MSDRAAASELDRAAASPYDIRRTVKRWLADGRSQGHSDQTIRDRERTMDRFAWWLENEEETAPTLAALDPLTIRSFLSYLREPKKKRWNSDHHSASLPMRPASVNAYFRIIRAFGNWCVAEGLMQEGFRRNVKAPKIPKDKLQPFTAEELQRLVHGARGSTAPVRDVAIVLLLVDTGMRVSELCGLTIGSVDRGEGALRVTGKGNKQRTVCMGRNARSALWRYLEMDRGKSPADRPLFVSVGGNRRGDGMTPRGVHAVIAEAGKRAGITGVRCSPHTLRHTFAIVFLRNGGNLLELQELLGHEDLTTLQVYVNLAREDVEQAHRKASPADRLKLR